MKLIVGLGNPGREYVGTRHNLGFEALDRFAGRLGWIQRPEDFARLARSAFDGLTMDGFLPLSSGASEKVVLLKPMTYVNLSGRCIQAATAFFQLPLEDLLVVLDDLALPLGRIRIRPGGSSGGHNGLKDIERMLGTSRYPRLRVGIDSPPQHVPGRDYVLGRISAAERTELEPALGRAALAVERWITSGIDAAMSEFNAEATTEE